MTRSASAPRRRLRTVLAAALRAALTGALLTVVAMPAAQAACGPEGTVPIRPVVNLRVDNDLFGGRGQDRGYTNGVHLSVKSGNLVGFDDACLPAPVSWMNRGLDWLYRSGLDQKNVVLSFSHALFTPSEPERSTLDPDDRPYAGAILLGVGYNARSGDKLRTTQLRVGMVGPSALGEQVQNGWHKLFGMEEWRGWSTQLRDEPVIQLVHERTQRWAPERAGAWSWDMISHWGVSLGNLLTHANAGLELRAGLRLPDDFGSDPIRPAGENSAPVSRASTDDWAWHVFVSVDGRAVLHNITLDGNTWKDSHSVERRLFVADIGRGVAITRGRWKFAFARYSRTREFEGQKVRPVFGSFTVSRRF